MPIGNSAFTKLWNHYNCYSAYVDKLCFGFDLALRPTRCCSFVLVFEFSPPFYLPKIKKASFECGFSMSTFQGGN